MNLSIAMCTYNGCSFLESQLDSILNQTVTPTELIISDDSSSDNTISILQDFKRTAPFEVSIYQNEKRLGTRKNFERAIASTNGEIIFLADQDDIWKTDKMEEYLRFFLKEPKALLVFSNGDLINENGGSMNTTLWEHWKFDKETKEEWNINFNAFKCLLKNENKVTGATIAFRTELKKLALPFYFDTPLWHDAWLALIAAGKNGLRFIDKPLIWYRVHDEQQVGIGNGYLMDPFGTNKNVLTTRQRRLAQLNFEQRLASILPLSDIFNDQQIADELSFLNKKENYSKYLFQRIMQVMHWKQIMNYNKFCQRPIRTIIKDILN